MSPTSPQRSTRTKVPGIHRARFEDPNLQRVIDSITEVVEVGRGIRGQELDRYATMRDKQELEHRINELIDKSTDKIISIASANPLVIPDYGKNFIVTGTTNFGSISDAWEARRILLIFADSLTIASGTFANFGSDIAVSANDTLDIFYDNSGNWLII